MPKPNVKITIDKVDTVVGAINELSKTRVLVGIPAEKALRDGPISNAAIGYIQEFGAPEVKIPPRPFLKPGVASVNDSSTVPRLRQAAEAAFSGNAPLMTRCFMAAGQKASDAVRAYILHRIPPPLKPGTLLGRLRRKKKYQRVKSAEKRAELREEALSGSEGNIPLFDTGQLARRVTYVIRRK